MARLRKPKGPSSPAFALSLSSGETVQLEKLSANERHRLARVLDDSYRRGRKGMILGATTAVFLGYVGIGVLPIFPEVMAAGTFIGIVGLASAVHYKRRQTREELRDIGLSLALSKTLMERMPLLVGDLPRWYSTDERIAELERRLTPPSTRNG